MAERGQQDGAPLRPRRPAPPRPAKQGSSAGSARGAVGGDGRARSPRGRVAGPRGSLTARRRIRAPWRPGCTSRGGWSPSGRSPTSAPTGRPGQAPSGTSGKAPAAPVSLQARAVGTPTGAAPFGDADGTAPPPRPCGHASLRPRDPDVSAPRPATGTRCHRERVAMPQRAGGTDPHRGGTGRLRPAVTRREASGRPKRPLPADDGPHPELHRPGGDDRPGTYGRGPRRAPTPGRGEHRDRSGPLGWCRLARAWPLRRLAGRSAAIRSKAAKRSGSCSRLGAVPCTRSG